MDNNLINKFVRVINETGLEPLFEKDVPEELRSGEVNGIPGLFHWAIRESETNGWVHEVESMLPYPFPRLYSELLKRFRFAEFELGPILFLANTGTDVFNELSKIIKERGEFQSRLLGHGLLQFGRQSGGGFDPVCFDMKQSRKSDAPLVQLDHEEIIIRDRVRVVKEIAPSFHVFVEQTISGFNG